VSRLRTIGTVAAVLVGGAAVSVGLVSFGCIGANPPLVAYCGHDPITPVVIVSLAVWLVLGTLFVAIRGIRNNE